MEDKAEKKGIEFLLDPKNDRNNLFPIQFSDIWDLYNTAKASFWVPEEIDFSADIADWDSKLTDNEKRFLELNFAFFSVFDQVVIKNLETDFISKITIPEIRFFYRFQEMMEDIHVHTYSLFPEMFIKDQKRKNEIINAVESFQSIANMVTWAKKQINSDFVHKIITFILVEGVFFSGAFASIFFMKKKGVLAGLCQSNELIARDEGLHTDFGILIYSYVNNKLSKEEYKILLFEAIELTRQFSVETSSDMIGMNSDLMFQYIKYVSDNISERVIGERVYGVSNPFPWMLLQSLQGKTNFFDRKVTQYSKPAVMNKGSDNSIAFDDESF